MAKDFTVCCYYFPNYHVDARNEQVHGNGWTEWELVKRAEPRFAGHHQPRVPAWGYTDEDDPVDMAQKIDAAADHGIDCFIFDWYWYDDGPYLQRGLEEGFLKAANCERLKFCCMWANHDWVNIHPAKRRDPRECLYPGVVTPETFTRLTDHVIQQYFTHPSHWLIDGCPYFSVYELNKLLQSFGSVDATRAALADFRTRTKAAGFPDLHLNAVVWGRPILPGESTPADPAKLVVDLGFDSVTSYVWIHHGFPGKGPLRPYEASRDGYFAYWDKAVKMFDLPYYPNVSMGWDSSPRTLQSDIWDASAGYPFTAILDGNTPEAFRSALQQTRDRLEALRGPRILNLNAWNEWTEGSYLEPDTRTGMAYLEAVKAVFGS